MKDDKKKNKNAQGLTALRNQILTPERRKEIASLAARARWGRVKTKEGKK